jgi:hypothetical protein
MFNYPGQERLPTEAVACPARNAGSNLLLKSLVNECPNSFDVDKDGTTLAVKNT